MWNYYMLIIHVNLIDSSQLYLLYPLEKKSLNLLSKVDVLICIWYLFYLEIIRPG